MKKDKAILIRLSEEFKQEIEIRAKELQLAPSAYCRMVIQKEITRLNDEKL